MTRAAKLLEDQVAVITGAASGIGRASARLFADNGARLVLADLNEQALSEFEIELREAGLEVSTIVGDVSDSRVAERIVGSSKQFGAINVLFNNAGIDLHASLEETKESDWDRIMNVNLRSVFLLSKAAIPLMSTDGSASIINTSSAAGIYPISGRPAYVASKGAVIALTKAMALDLAPGIRVNCICPGAVETPLLESSMGESLNRETARETVRCRYPLGRLAQPEEIGETALFLASKLSSYITGATIAVDAGRTMH